jgi:hypothetical protein
VEYFRDEAKKRAQSQKKWVKSVEFHYGSILVILNEAPHIMEVVHIIKRLLHELDFLKRDSTRVV